MPIVSKSQVVANGATFNPFAGSIYEFMGFAATLEAGLTADAAGVTFFFSSGTDVLAESGSPAQVAAAGIGPKYPDDYKLRDAVAPGDRLVCNILNSSGANRTVLFEARLTPIVA